MEHVITLEIGQLIVNRIVSKNIFLCVYKKIANKLCLSLEICSQTGLHFSKTHLMRLRTCSKIPFCCSKATPKRQYCCSLSCPKRVNPASTQAADTIIFSSCGTCAEYSRRCDDSSAVCFVILVKRSSCRNHQSK